MLIKKGRSILKTTAFSVVAVAGLTVSNIVSALEEFIIQDIEIDGLQRLDAGTVFNYLPLTIGDQLNDANANNAIEALYNTGLFQNVRFEQDNNILVIIVEEFPSIAEVNLEGNDQLKDDDLRNAFEQVDLVQGRIYQKEVVERVADEIKNQYFSLGRYNAKVNPVVEQTSQNRVNITFEIEEGEVAKITEIKVLGNEVFSDKEITSRLLLEEKGLFTIFNKRDRYSKQKLSADLETIRSYYYDNGYLDFDIESTQVSITPDKKDVYITIAITEGEPYTFSGFSVEGELNNVPMEDLTSTVLLEPGDRFSLKDINEAKEAMTKRMASEGFAFNEISTVSQTDEENNTVSYIFAINPGKRTYVRNINISGNDVTQDEVIRREIRQLEGSTFSSDQIDRSRERLVRLGYFDNIEIETTPVPGSLDVVDLDVNVEERSTGNFLVGVGYSNADGILLRGSVTQRNLFGTGKELSISADESDAVTSYDLTYRNPYYTTSGISRGFRLNYREVDSEELDTASFLLDQLSAGVFYSFPLSEYNSFNIGGDVVNVELEDTDTTPPEYQDFIDEHDDDTYVRLTSSIAHDTRDSLLWPTKGGLIQLSGSASLPGGDTEYYKADLKGVHFQPVVSDFVLKTEASIGYGDGYGDTDELPFYENFFAGGISTVRGYEARSLGPRDTGVDNDPTGGSQRILASAELLFPFPGAAETKDKRLGLFFDAGQVYQNENEYSLGDLRYSAGVTFYWSSPVGPIALSWAEPLNDESGDETETFQFTVGTTF